MDDSTSDDLHKIIQRTQCNVLNLVIRGQDVVHLIIRNPAFDVTKTALSGNTKMSRTGHERKVWSFRPAQNFPQVKRRIVHLRRGVVGRTQDSRYLIKYQNMHCLAQTLTTLSIEKSVFELLRSRIWQKQTNCYVTRAETSQCKKHDRYFCFPKRPMTPRHKTKGPKTEFTKKTDLETERQWDRRHT